MGRWCTWDRSKPQIENKDVRQQHDTQSHHPAYYAPQSCGFEAKRLDRFHTAELAGLPLLYQALSHQWRSVDQQKCEHKCRRDKLNGAKNLHHQVHLARAEQLRDVTRRVWSFAVARFERNEH